MIVMTILSLIQLTIAQIIIHSIYTKFGFSFLGADIEREGNEQVLNNLEEGVIILEANDSKKKKCNKNVFLLLRLP